MTAATSVAARSKEPHGHGGPSKSKLTLSAYCRPERAVRLTDAPPARVLRTDYILPAPSRDIALGRGARATVRLARRRRDGRPVAVKTIAKHDALGRLRDRLGAGGRCGNLCAPRLDEADLLATLRDCPGVVRLLDVYETHQEVHLVLEYCAGGDLFERLRERQRRAREARGPNAAPLVRGSFTEAETATIARRLLGALDQFHSRNIVHRDIKPSNILIADDDDAALGSVKLADFDLARRLQDSPSTASVVVDPPGKKRRRAYSRVGSDYYAAPEVHLGAGYDTPVDVYSLGITLFVLLCGTPPSSASPFTSADADVTHEDASCITTPYNSTPAGLCCGVGPFPSELHISTAARDLISKMIHPDPERRITAAEALRHTWFQQSLYEDAGLATHETSKLSLFPRPRSSSGVPRATSFADTESLLRIGPVIAAVSLSNSAVTPEASSTPRAPAVHGHASVSLTLADVCQKLAPWAEDPRLHPLGAVRASPKKRARGDSRRAAWSEGAWAEKKARLSGRLVRLPHSMPH